MSRLLVMPRRDDPRADAEATQKRLLGARLLLVTGTGGSGKRIVGNMLVDERSYVHIDFDNPHANERFLGHGVDGLKAELEANLEPGQELVVTWTPERRERRAAVRPADAVVRLRLGLARRRSRRRVPRLLQRPRTATRPGSSIRSRPTGGSARSQPCSTRCSSPARSRSRCPRGGGCRASSPPSAAGWPRRRRAAPAAEARAAPARPRTPSHRRGRGARVRPGRARGDGVRPRRRLRLEGPARAQVGAGAAGDAARARACS